MYQYILESGIRAGQVVELPGFEQLVRVLVPVPLSEIYGEGTNPPENPPWTYNDIYHVYQEIFPGTFIARFVKRSNY